MAARCLLLVWVKSAKGIPQPRANVFQERGRCWGILPSGGAVLGIVPGHGGHRHRQDLRQPVLDGGDDLEKMKSGLSSQKGITMLRQHRTIPALRLKHRSGGCGTASALPKCSIMSGCGTRIVLRGAKAPRTLRPLPLLRFAVSATGGAHLCSIQYYLRFWLSICRTSLAVSALRIMRYCPSPACARYAAAASRQCRFAAKRAVFSDGKPGRPGSSAAQTIWSVRALWRHQPGSGF